MTYINEFPHPRVAVHFHPTSKQLTFDDVEYALDHRVHAIELDLHYRPSDGKVICNHDKVTDESRPLDEIIEHILGRKGEYPTVNHDGRQFFLVLEPKENSAVLFHATALVLERYAAQFSTAVSKGDAPRGITVVITGAYPREFYAHFPPDRVNRLCIAETHDYAGEMANLSPKSQPFQWVSIRYGEGMKTRVDALHNGTDPAVHGRFNVRIWDGHKHMADCLTDGADSVNADRDEITTLQGLIANQPPKSTGSGNISR